MSETKYKFEFNFAEINLILKGCKELPYKESAGLIQTIVNEYTKQAKEFELASRKDQDANKETKA